MPLSPEQHYGYTDNPDKGILGGVHREIPLCTFPDLERAHLIRFAGSSTLRILITDLDMETPAGHDQFAKPAFLFGDRITADDQVGYVEDSRMLREINDRFFFLPSMKRMYPLSYFSNVRCRRGLAFDLVKEQENVSFGFGRRSRVQIGGQLKGLRPGRFEKKDLAQEAPLPANVFIRQFIAARGEFPTQSFRSPGWLSSGEGGWWTRMVDFVLEELKEPLAQSGLTIPVRATRYGVVQGYPSFFAILERYNPDSCTFFTPAGELGFALHEMHAVSGLSLGKIPYEEFIPTTEELSILKAAHPEIYATFWELMCHFHICAQVIGMRGGGIMHTAWADYLFQNLSQKDSNVVRLAASSLKNIKARVKAPHANYKSKHLEDGFEAGTEFESFHYQAATPISDSALLAGFLMMWLKRCVVPSKPVEAILADVVYPAVLLAHGRPLSLLTAMVSCLQRGLRDLSSEFSDVREITAAGKKIWKTSQPRVPVPYTYLVAWFVLHCPSLMTGIMQNNETSVPFVQRLESATWSTMYIVRARQLLSLEDSYNIFCCHPCFDGAEDEDTKFADVVFEGSSALNEGLFQWLLSIRVGYLVFRLSDRCIIEPYVPSRFARQFGYDQLYVGNPNPQLAYVGNLYEGARAWSFFLARGTHAQFTLPNLPPSCSSVEDFQTWFTEASQISEYDLYSSCITEIRELYRSRSSGGRTRLPGIGDFLSCEREMIEASQGLEKLPAAESSKEDASKGTQEESPAVEPPEGEASNESPVETSAAEAPGRKDTGKQALTITEADEYERRLRKRKPALAKNSKRAKLMGDAMKSTPVVSPENGEDVMPQSALPGPDVPMVEQRLTTRDSIPKLPEGLSSKGTPRAIRTDYAKCFTYPPTAPPPGSETLKKLIEQFEYWMQMTVDVVSLGEVSFKVFEPHLVKCLNQIAQQGSAWWHDHCSESLVILEYELQFLSMLRHDDLGPEVDQALSQARTAREQRREALQKSLSEKEAHLVNLREKHNVIQTDVGCIASGIRDAETAIARLEIELARKRAQLVEDVEVCKDLTTQSDQIFKEYCDELVAADEIRREIAEPIPSEEELREKATKEVQKTREEDFATLKAKLKSWRLMKPGV